MIPLSYNLRGLAVRRASTAASALGIAMVVFVLASALMLSAGIKRTLGKSGRADTVVVLRKGSDAEMTSVVEEQALKLILAGPGVRRTPDGAALAVGEVVVVVIGEKLGSTTGALANVMVRGVPDSVLAFRPGVHIVAGRPARPGTNEMLVGARVRGRFRGLDLHQTFELRKGKPAPVVGIFADDGSSFESEVWVGIDAVRNAFGREGMVSAVRLRLESAQKFPAFQAYVEQDKRLGLTALRETVYYEKVSQGTSLFVSVLGTVIAVFFSLGAMIGAMITMYAAIADRRREIGVLRALGFSRGGILVAFLLESLLLSLVGGIIGVGGSLAMGFVHISLMNFGSWSQIIVTLTPTSVTLLTSLVAAGAMGLLGGLLPAVRAARVSPVVAMRG